MALKKNTPEKGFILFAMDSGDRSVGINPAQVSLVIDGDPDMYNEEQRGYLRKSFRKFVEENGLLELNISYVWFSDECSECLQKKCQCPKD